VERGKNKTNPSMSLLEKGEIKKMKKLLCCHVFIPGCLLAMFHLKKHGWCQTIFE